MATWPSASKASTNNLDQGSDSPRLARADIKQNVDNVNDIIDMFNISSPSNNQILKYNTSNARFELGTDTATGGITFVGDDSTGTEVSLNETFKIAGTQNITTAVSGDTITVTGPNLSSYLTAETNDLTSAVVWANVPNANITQGSVTQHQAALSITESQISDLQSYLTSETFTSLQQDTTPQLGGNLDVNGNNIVSVSNGNIVIQPNGTGDVDLDGEVRFNKNYKEDINALTSSAGITVDASLASVHSVTLAHNTTFTISNLPTGGSVTIIITQDATGSRTGAFTSVKFAGGTPTLTTDASAIDVVTIFNDGTNFLGTVAKAFAA